MNDGVLDKHYAHQRITKKYLQFRYKMRALVACSVIKKYLHQTNPIHLVDFGAAEGLTLMEMARILGEGEYTGIEFDESLIKSAPLVPDGIRLIQGNVSHCPMKDSSVDVITALALMEHLQHPEEALKEAARILKTGGLFVATAPVPFWDRHTDFLHTKETFGAKAHMTDMGEDMMRNMAKKSGLHMVEYSKFMLAPVGFLPYLKISISPRIARSIDGILQKTHLFGWLYVNQCFVLQKIT